MDPQVIVDELSFLKKELLALIARVKTLERTSCGCRQKEKVKEALDSFDALKLQLSEIQNELVAAEPAMTSDMQRQLAHNLTRIQAIETEIGIEQKSKRVAL